MEAETRHIDGFAEQIDFFLQGEQGEKVVDPLLDREGGVLEGIRGLRWCRERKRSAHEQGGDGAKRFHGWNSWSDEERERK